MPCENRKCGKTQAPYIDPETNEVFCSECQEPLKNVSSFAKSQMKSMKQYRSKTKQSFAVKCEKCQKETRPKDTGADIVCGACQKSLSVSPFFKNMLREQLKKADKDI